jgi:hypothetical protein
MRRFPPALFVLCLTSALAHAQGYSGTFTTVNPQGKTVTVSLQQAAQGRMTGTISNGEIALQVDGTVEDGEITGTATSSSGKLFFEAEVDGNTLYLTLISPDAQGQPDYEHAQEMELTATQQTGSLTTTAGVSDAAARAPSAGNPLAGGNPAAGSSPPAAADPVSGVYSNGQVTVQLQAAGAAGRYQGQIATGQQQWPVVVQLQPNGVLSGQFQSSAGRFDVAMQVQGNAMLMESGGQRYQLQKQGAGPPPGPSANPLAQPGTGPAAGTGAGGISDGTPMGNQWAQLLAGQKVTYISSYSSGTSGGYSARIDVYLCSSGDFLYKDESVVSVDVGGAFGNAGGNSRNTGHWRIITQGQLAGIELRYNDGRVAQYRLERRGNATYADGTRVYVTPAEICQ